MRSPGGNYSGLSLRMAWGNVMTGSVHTHSEDFPRSLLTSFICMACGVEFCPETRLIGSSLIPSPVTGHVVGNKRATPLPAVLFIAPCRQLEE